MVFDAYRLIKHYFDMIYVFLSSIVIPGTSFTAFNFFVGICSIGIIALVVKMFLK